jgi:hypothetical protein
MDKDDWIMLLYAIAMGLCAAGIVYALMLPQPPQQPQQYILKIEYTPAPQEKR